MHLYSYSYDINVQVQTFQKYLPFYEMKNPSNFFMANYISFMFGLNVALFIYSIENM